MARFLLAWAIFSLPVIRISAAPDAKASSFPLAQTDIFEAGKDGYNTYRIPSLIVTAKGTVLAFCEGRRKSSSDTGDIDIVLRRSFDNGATWQPMQIVADDSSNTLGNPCPVVDRATGTIWLPLTRNLGSDTEDRIRAGTSKESRTVWMSKSTDDGATWSKPEEITKTTKRPDWTWYATGPGVGVQLRSGRLLIPCDNNVAGSKMRQSHVIYSDNHGATWKLGGVATPNVNECQVVERSDGSLLLNMRCYEGKNRRAITASTDGGLTWSQPTLDPTLIEPVCQASLLRYVEQGGSLSGANRPQRDGRQVDNLSYKSRLLFSNPAAAKRENMTVRLSYDEGKTWPTSKTLHAGPSAYSCLTVLSDMTIGCLYERGEKRYAEKVTFARFSLEWLTDGADHVERKK
jgi:sialidase-1